jgi:hypothetical protein
MAEETTAPGAAGGDDAAIVQRAREKAAASQCRICLDDHPEVMSLCCGIAHKSLCDGLDYQIRHMHQLQKKN